MQRFSHIALIALFLSSACLHFEDTYLGESTGVDASSGMDGGGADASLGLTLSVESTDLRLGSGSVLNVLVSIERSNGLSGDVSVNAAATSLPSGVSVTPIVIPAGDTTGTLAFASVAAPAVGLADVRLEATLGGIIAGADLPLFVVGVTSSFDTSFNGGAGVTLPAATEIQDLAVTASGRVLVLANESGWKVVAFTDEGVLDTSFGTNGRTSLPAGLNPVSLKLRPGQNAGFLVAVNNTSPVQAGVAAFTENGSTDPSFNSGVGFISTIAAQGGTTIVSDMAIAPDGRIFLAGSHVGGSEGAIYEFSPVGLFTDNMVTSPITANFKHIRLHNNKLAVGGQKKGVPPVFVLARFGTNLALDPTFAGDGTYESPQVPRSYQHMDLDSAGRIAVTVIDQNNPTFVSYFLDANASTTTAILSGFSTGSSNFGGEGVFGPDDNYALVINGCSNSCQFKDSEVLAMVPSIPPDGTYTLNSALNFPIDNQDMDAAWSLDRVTVDPNLRILIAGQNAGTTTVLRVWP